jgi:hypothetical protein
VLLIYGTHQCCCGGKYLVDKNKDGFLRRELDTLADYIDELPNRKILLAEISRSMVYQ